MVRLKTISKQQQPLASPAIDCRKHTKPPYMRHVPKQSHANISENRFTAHTPVNNLPPANTPLFRATGTIEIVGKHEETR